MDSKKTVLREAEEIIETYIKKQQALSRRFHKKNKESKRHNLRGIGLLLSLGVSLLLWGLILWWIF